MPIKVILSFSDDDGNISEDDIRKAIETHGIGFAESPAEVAKEALACIIDPESSPIFDVIPWIDDAPPNFTCNASNCISVEL